MLCSVKVVGKVGSDRVRTGSERVNLEGFAMAALLLFLVLVALLLGAGVAYNMLLWIGLIALVLWIVGFAYRPAGGRWYYW